MSLEKQMEIKTGKVWLVGAGPSDQELMTLKGKRVLEQADVIVYDRLCGAAPLTYGNPEARYIDVGKQAGNHTLPQEQINEILVREGRNGSRVVRLKGGDPFVFGRGGEEAEALAEAGVPFEIVPGVTSATAVPAYQGIPVTHRDASSSFHVITAHKKQGGITAEQFRIWASLTGTLIFLMGAGSLRMLCEGMRAAGKDPGTPAAVLERGTTARQRKITGTLGTLPEIAEKAQIHTPAIIMVGQVCTIKDLEWYQKRPLAGKKILVTRPRERSGRIAAMLREKGAEVLEVPSIRLKRIENPKVIKELEDSQWLVLTSPGGAGIFLDMLKEAEIDIRKLAHVKIAVVGPGTGEILRANGIIPDLMPDTYDGEHLGRCISKAVKPGEKILIARAKAGNPELVREISGAKDIQVADMPVYETCHERLPFLNLKEEIEDGMTDYVMFTSASAVAGFVNADPDIDFKKVRALCIGRQTMDAAVSYGMQCEVAAEATLDALVELAERVAQDENSISVS